MLQRLDSIDAARTCAIILMVFCHFTIFLSSPSGEYPRLYFFGDHIVGDLAAPLFLFLVGVSFSASCNAKTMSGFSERDILLSFVKRGCRLFPFGLFFVAVVWGPDQLFIWDILTTIASCTLILIPFRKLKPRTLLLLALFILLLSPLLRSQFSYPRFWKGDEYSPPFVLLEIIGGYLLNGYFPLFPWLAYSIVGYAIGKAIFFNSDRISRRGYRNLLPLFSLLFLLFGFGGAWISSEAHLSFYPLSTTLFSIELGMCLLLVGPDHVPYFP